MHFAAGGVAAATHAHVTAHPGSAAPPEPPGNQPARELGEADHGSVGEAVGGADQSQRHHLPDVHQPGGCNGKPGNTKLTQGKL